MYIENHTWDLLRVGDIVVGESNGQKYDEYDFVFYPYFKTIVEIQQHMIDNTSGRRIGLSIVFDDGHTNEYGVIDRYFVFGVFINNV